MNVVFFPGQGTQFKGMGKELWARYPEQAEVASRVLGYSIVDLCMNDAGTRLSLTQYAQPALYVVNALAYQRWREEGGKADALAGHSLGEYSALLAAACFDFETGLRLVQRRGQLMSEANGGAMTAILGMRAEALRTLLDTHGLDGVDLANHNSPTQTVIAGRPEELEAAAGLVVSRGGRAVTLNVSAAFHSRHMRCAQDAFSLFVQDFSFSDPVIPVIANVTGRPYQRGEVARGLAQQIASPVLWTDSVRYLMACDPAFSYVEIGIESRLGKRGVLGKLIDEIRQVELPIQAQTVSAAAPHGVSGLVIAPPAGTAVSTLTAERLGSKVFRERHALKYAYVAGAMYRGIASTALVVQLGRAGMLGFFGTGGLSLDAIEQAIGTLQAQLTQEQGYGLNFLADYAEPDNERAIVELYLRHGVRCIEAAAFTQVTQALVLFRARGLHRDALGHVRCAHRIIAKVSRLEVAEAFMSPAPSALIEVLRAQGAITADQATMAAEVPLSHDVCVEADSGGHTDKGIPTILLPAMRRLAQTIARRYGYAESLCIGLAGGIGTPESAAAAFIMGADFIVTGSINQCTVESGATDVVKTMLQAAGIHDMAYAPAGDMFEMGAKVQVLRKGVLFPMRASRLHALYSHYDSLDAIPETIRRQLEQGLFKRSLDAVWEQTERRLRASGRSRDLALAQSNPKVRMARVFRWYFAYSNRLALSGSPDDVANYQVHTGPALGAFNQWVQGSALESWRQRHVDEIALALLEATAVQLRAEYDRLLA